MASRSPRANAPKWVAVALVMLLALGVGALALLAYQRTAPQQSQGSSEPVPSFAFGDRTPTPTPTASPPVSDGEAVGTRAEERFLSVGSQAMWRSTAGECGAVEPLVERSNDGGQTWVDVTPRYLGIGQVAALNAFTAADAELVAAMGTACETQALRTFTQGDFWESYPDVLTASRYVDLADATIVSTPAGQLTAPCADPRSLRAEGDLIALVCDGSAWTWSADAWSALPAPSVLALDVVDGAVVIAHVTPDSCSGVAVSRFPATDAATLEPVACAEAADPTTPVALDAQDVLFLWSGPTLFRLELPGG